MKITKNMVEHWIGSDAKKEDIISILTEIVNGDYSLELLNQDIINTWE